MADDLRAAQAELLLPHEVEAALAVRSVAYLPLGSIEFHSAHLPIGLDGLTAHGVCLRAAARSGGIVLPPLFHGVGGGHTTYPWTIMGSSDGPIRALLELSLARLQDFGVRLAVLFTGHFADEQLALVDEVASGWNARGGALRALGLAVNRADASVAPDHAGIFETSLLSAIAPDRVQLERLASLAAAPARDPGGDEQGAHRHDPTHPLHGVFGPDPRTFDPRAAGGLLDEVVAWTVAQVDHVVQVEHPPNPSVDSEALR
jgi:creatinine amidohydrolase